MNGQGAQRAAGEAAAVASGETYVGYERASNLASSPKAVPDQPTVYTVPTNLPLNAWGYAGRWTVGDEKATLAEPAGRLVYRFRARDLHLVLGPGAKGKPVRFRVLLDGQPPGAAHGTDISADGSGVVTEQRLYQLIRQPGIPVDRTFSIEFLDSGATAYAFTFG